MTSAVTRLGTAAQRGALLPRVAPGALRGGVGLPAAGTDLQGIRTRAVLVDTGGSL